VRLTWRKEARSYRIGAGPRGAELYADGVRVGSVSSLHAGGLNPVHQHGGWHWVCPSNERLGIAYQNTWLAPLTDIDVAKAACEAYIRECLRLPEKKR
jgi:hypothetical protein